MMARLRSALGALPSIAFSSRLISSVSSGSTMRWYSLGVLTLDMGLFCR